MLPRTIVYDPDLTLGLPAAVSAASGMNAIAHCVEALWVADRTPVTEALAVEAVRRFGRHLPRVVADGTDREARAQCLIGAWLAGAVLTAGTALQHKLAHVLGGLGLPHAETHAIILPHVTRFNLAAAPAARAARRGPGRRSGRALAAMLPAFRSRSGCAMSASIGAKSISSPARWRRCDRGAASGERRGCTRIARCRVLVRWI